MKNLSTKKQIAIICGVIALLAIILIAISCLEKKEAPEKETGNSLQTESQEETSDIGDVTDSAKNEDAEGSKDETLNSTKEETETQKDTYDDIFEDKQETTDDKSEDKSEDKQENDSNDKSEDSSSDKSDEDVTMEEETKEKLEESEDTSTGYGPIS